MAISERDRLVRPISHQIHYTLQAREAEQELVSSAVDQGLGLMNWSALAVGLLSGKHRRGHQSPEGTRQMAQWSEPPVYDIEKLYDLVEVLIEVAESHNVSAAQVALAWLLTRPAVSTIVIGARTEKQLVDNLKAAELTLTASDVSKLEKASHPNLAYPFWHQVSTASDRFGPADIAAFGDYLTDLL